MYPPFQLHTETVSVFFKTERYLGRKDSENISCPQACKHLWYPTFPLGLRAISQTKCSLLQEVVGTVIAEQDYTGSILRSRDEVNEGSSWEKVAGAEARLEQWWESSDLLPPATVHMISNH